MLDDFREQANEAALFEEEDLFDELPPPPARHFLGMTPAQRFVVALMLLTITLILSTFCLLVTEKVVLPFG